MSRLSEDTDDDDADAECATGLPVNISPIRPKDSTTAMENSCSEKLPPETEEEKLRQDEHISASPPFSEDTDDVVLRRPSAVISAGIELFVEAQRLATRLRKWMMKV